MACPIWELIVSGRCLNAIESRGFLPSVGMAHILLNRKPVMSGTGYEGAETDWESDG